MKKIGMFAVLFIMFITGCSSGGSDAVPADTSDYTSTNIGTLKYVPAGSFQRGTTSTNIIIISTAFRMSQYEITRAQFLAIMGTDPSETSYSSGTSDPVQMVNWYHAIAFCNKLSIAEGLTSVYSVSGINFTTLTYAAIPTTSDATWDAATADWTANGYRLPTEMEWMWAAMGATSDGISADIVGGVNTGGYTKGYAGSIEAGGAQVNIGDYAWTWENSSGNDMSQPVGTKLPNELGLYDMSGNVWEWCWDWDGIYPTGTQSDYRGAASGTHRIIRGGSWYYSASLATVALRSNYPPSGQLYYYGFRVVRP
jgi:formylglycine-generating enzyme required for sulfatase activity